MKRGLTYALAALLLLAPALPGMAQADRHEVRAGNRKFKKGGFKEAEIDYRKAVLKDSLSVAGEYDLASSLYRQQDYEGAGKALQTIKDVAPAGDNAAKWQYNRGDVALQQKDYATAVDAFRQALLLEPDDLDAKENYIYAKLMLQNQQNGGGGGQNQDNQDQDQDQDQDQNQDQQQDQQNQQDQQQNQNQNQDNQERQQEQKISPQQAQQMLQAIQAREKETQDKVKKEKAAALKSRQKEKNW